MLMFTGSGVPGAFQQLAASPGEVYTLTGFGLTPEALVASGAVPYGGIQISYFSAALVNLGTVETGVGAAKGDFSITVGTTPFSDWRWSSRLMLPIRAPSRGVTRAD
jgi:hypothetical protein